MFAKAAALHKKQFEKLVDGAGALVDLRMPATPVVSTAPVDKVMGKRPTPTTDATSAYGETVQVKAVQSVGVNITTENGVPSSIVALGQTDQLDILLRCKLADVLVDPLRPLGRTIFSTAKDVVLMGEVFTVTGVDASGLPPLGPYICWVGLKKAGSRV